MSQIISPLTELYLGKYKTGHNCLQVKKGRKKGGIKITQLYTE